MGQARTIGFDEDGRPPVREDGEPALVVDVGGYEGPLDLLLDLARRQKVDLREISILALAEQYIAFVEEARRLRLELAADYLVMAAWLAYLKSRLLLPEPPKGEEPSAEDLATALADRLRRLELIRAAARALDARERLGRDFHARGAPEPIAIRTRPLYEASLYDLLKAYAQQRQKQAASRVTMRRRLVWSLVEAREALERLLGARGRLVRTRRLAAGLHDDAGAARHGARFRTLRLAGARARGQDRPAPGPHVRGESGSSPRSASTPRRMEDA